MESIYSLIPKEEVKTEKAPRYQSKFRDNACDNEKRNKESYATMGPAKSNKESTDQYLKKRAKEPVLPPKEKFNYTGEKKPAIPGKGDQPLMGLKTNKNFIATNAIENITSIPKKPEKKYVDSKKGDAQGLEKSGMEPVYVNKKDFGEVPGYLVQRKDDMANAQQEYDEYVQEHFRRGAMNQLNTQERDVILKGLKANWEDIHREYQGLSVVTDTAPKKNRKERMEAEMKQLERDIETIEKHKCIFINN